jgi:hypothetical protein
VGIDFNDMAAIDPEGVRQAVKMAMRLPTGFMTDDDEPITRPPELIRDCLPRHGTGTLIGQSGAGKTFVAIHLQLSLAAEAPFFAREVVESVGSVHLAYEGAGNLKRRVRAARRHAGLGFNLPFLYAARAGNLFDAKHRKETIGALKSCARWFEEEFEVRHGVTMIDTASAAFIFKDENSNAEIAAAGRVLAEIADATGAFTCLIHHMGKNAQAGARGGSAWRGNVDFSLSCLADREADRCSNRRLVIDKSREGPEEPLGAFELVPMEIGTEEDGKPFHSMAISYTGQVRASAAMAAPRSIITLRQAFDEVSHTHGRRHTVLRGYGIASPTVTAAPIATVRTEFYRRWATGEPDIKKAQAARQKAFTRALKESTADFGRETDLKTGEELMWRL